MARKAQTIDVLDSEIAPFEGSEGTPHGFDPDNGAASSVKTSPPKPTASEGATTDSKSKKGSDAPPKETPEQRTDRIHRKNFEIATGEKPPPPEVSESGSTATETPSAAKEPKEEPAPEKAKEAILARRALQLDGYSKGAAEKLIEVLPPAEVKELAQKRIRVQRDNRAARRKLGSAVKKLKELHPDDDWTGLESMADSSDATPETGETSGGPDSQTAKTPADRAGDDEDETEDGSDDDDLDKLLAELEGDEPAEKPKLKPAQKPGELTPHQVELFRARVDAAKLRLAQNYPQFDDPEHSQEIIGAIGELANSGHPGYDPTTDAGVNAMLSDAAELLYGKEGKQPKAPPKADPDEYHRQLDGNPDIPATRGQQPRKLSEEDKDKIRLDVAQRMASPEEGRAMLRERLQKAQGG